MGSDNECHVVIANGRSGFCDCGAEGRVGFTCEHPAFTCADVCDKGRPADEDSMSCISWRRTGRCSARGPREEQFDLPCTAAIVAGVSGYCECERCAGGACAAVKANEVGCGGRMREAFTCANICKAQAASSSSSAGAASRSSAAGTGTCAAGDHDCASRYKIQQQVQQQRLDDNRQPPPDAPPMKANPMECVSWRRTGNCDPDGPREAAGDQACDEEVAKGASGYCECEHCAPGHACEWKRVKEVRCGHRAFKCADVCREYERYNCVGWRQTGQCDPHGPREPDLDRPCSSTVDGDRSGYCECGLGRKLLKVGCKEADSPDFEPFTCKAECEREEGLYEMLQVDPTASDKDIKKAFRKASLKFHPDKFARKVRQREGWCGVVYVCMCVCVCVCVRCVCVCVCLESDIARGRVRMTHIPRMASE